MTGARDGGYHFGRFVVGSSNRLAVSAARAVAEAPGQVYNPLFIYGGSGLGKTHLATAIAHRVRAAKPGIRVEYTSGEAVAQQWHRVIASGQPHRFMEHFRQVDLLIVDDVQFLTGQRETQSELLRLFNDLQDTGRQLVLTSDRQPSEIPDVDARLLSRLSGGLVVDVGAPDYEMRCAIARNVAVERGVPLADGVLNEVARLPFSNVRELIGALNKLVAFQQLEGTPVAPPDVRAVLGDAAPQAPVLAFLDDAPHDGGMADDHRHTDIRQQPERHLEPWRATIHAAMTHWADQGFRIDVLNRALTLPTPPDVDGLLAMFASATEHLRLLEAQAAALNPALRAHALFRDVEAIAKAEQLLAYTVATIRPLPAPSPQFTREQFDVTHANQLAVKAVDTVIQQKGTRYNPLFLCGPTGSGKTHLAHALGNALRSRAAVACLSASVFVDELITALQDGEMDRWRARFRTAELFILDDVDALAGKERTQEEFFHLFNSLYERGSQIVLTSTRPPRELPGLADRLRSRFEGGLVVTLQSRERTPSPPAHGAAAGARDHFFDDQEKTMWDWPEAGGRLIEEYR